MEFHCQDIAQLVLGYLKEVKCKSAFYEFLNKSEYLQEHARNYRRKGYYLITRVRELTLVEYLEQYAEIYTIVQGRLEASDYYKEGSRRSLIEQILYLLDRNSDRNDLNSRTSTPINPDCAINRLLTLENTSNHSNTQHVPSSIHSALDEFSTVNNITPSNKLQTSSSRDSSLLNKSKDKCKVPTPTVDKSTSTEDDTDEKENSHEKCGEIFTSTFLDNAELIEKLASNINKEVSSKSTIELDNTAIESIVQMTETDPILVQLLTELIEPNAEGNENLDVEIISDTSDEGSPDKNCAVTTPRNTTQPVSTDDSIKQRLRNSKCQQKNSEDVIIEDHNNDAVESIVAAASFTNDQLSESNSKSSTITSSELALPTEQCISQPMYTTTNNRNPSYPNTGSLLMLQPSANTNIVPQKTLSLDSSRPCYIIGNQPFVNVSVPQTPLKFTNVLSEQDILTMPTIFVCDSNQQIGNTPAMMMSTTGNSIGQPCYPNISLKGSPEKVQTLSEYITLYKCSESVASPCLGSPLKSKLVEKNTNSQKVLQSVSQCSVEVAHSAAISSLDILENSSEKASKSQTDSAYSQILRDTQLETPQNNIIEKRERLSRSAPKNSSLIRQLKFNTPDKWISQLPYSQSASSDKILDANESFLKSKKGNSCKSVRTTLFKSSVPDEDADIEKDDSEVKNDSDSNKGTEQLHKNLKPSWDASLRIFQVPTSPSRTVIERHKRKRQEEILNEVPLNTNEEIITKKSENTKPTSSTDSRKKSKISQKPKRPLSSEKKTKKKIKTSDESSDKGPENNVTQNSENLPQNVNNDCTVSKQYEVLNRVVKPRINKKCNMENVKNISICDEVVLTNVPKIKSCQVLEEGKNALILSPSALSANKRTLVEMEHHNVIDQNIILKCTNMDFTSSKTPENKGSDITDEEARMEPPQNRNELPILQTPIKYDSLHVPKTPGAPVVSSIDTPFTKAVIDQLNGVDITSIPTPKFPITPNFALTPAFTNSPFSNRGTDYSSASSYYQPSDTEQNKSLEQLIQQEYQSLEKQEIFSKENLDNRDQSMKVKEKVCGDNNVSSLVPKENAEVRDVDELPDPTETSEDSSINKILLEKQKAFNQSILGKKNMQLVKMLSDSAVDENNSSSDSSSSKNSSSSSSSSSSESESDTSACSCNVSPKIDNNRDPYSLRPRKTSSLNTVTTKDGNASIKNLECSIKDNEPEKLPNKDGVLKKMEEIRQRTIAKFKNSNTSAKPKTPVSTTKSASKLKRMSMKSSSIKAASKTPIRKTTGAVAHKLNTNRIAKETTKPKNNKNANINAVETCPTEKPSQPSKIPVNKSSVKISEEAVKSTNNIQTNDKQQTTITNVVKPLNRLLIEENKMNLSKAGSVVIMEEEEDIVLHLSSDDENLEPLEMVETQLLCSNSTTPTIEVSLAQDAHSTEKDLDTEAESLVQGLKEWGIHLIPNKTPKKDTVVPPEKHSNNAIEKKKMDSSLEEGEICETPPAEEKKKCEADTPQEKKTVLKEPNFNIQFENKTFEQETFIVRHNYDSRPPRKITDYRLEILTKSFSANVYIDEIDSEVEKLLSFTPLNIILDLPSKSTAPSVQKKTEKKVKSFDRKVEHSHLKRKTKPLNILYNELIQERDAGTHASPLDNLYASDTNLQNYKRSHKSVPRETGKNTRIESDKINKPKKSSNVETNLDKERPLAQKGDLSNSLNSKRLENSLMDSKKELVGNTDTVQPKTVTNTEDDLMNYALIGSERVVEDEDSRTLDKRKRNPNEADDDTQNHDEKKKKTEVCQELLRNVDVDSFLKQLHGDM